MTPRPAWLLWAIVGVAIVGSLGTGAYLLAKPSDDDGEPAVGENPADSTDGPASETPPECSRRAAKDAVLDSAFEASVRELGVVQADEPLFGGPGYFVTDVMCRDLTDDGVKELVVRLDCCAGGTPTPWAIFMAEGGAWQPAFSRTRILTSLSIEGDSVLERSPAYAAGEPICCPTTARVGRVSWDGNAFSFSSQDASEDRTIEVSSHGVTRLGEFRPRIGSPAQAANAFGPPSYVSPHDELCVHEWRDLGLVINFASLSGLGSCAADDYSVGSIELREELATQAGWKTNDGVRVGMSVQDLRQIYPDAQTQFFPGLGKVLVLIEGPTLVGVGGTYPLFSARIPDGAVDELQMSVDVAGE
jgi:hypothetical protein